MQDAIFDVLQLHSVPIFESSSINFGFFAHEQMHVKVGKGQV